MTDALRRLCERLGPAPWATECNLPYARRPRIYSADGALIAEVGNCVVEEQDQWEANAEGIVTTHNAILDELDRLHAAEAAAKAPPREATHAMLQAGYEVLKQIYPPKDNGGWAIGQKLVWENMYDAARAEIARLTDAGAELPDDIRVPLHSLLADAGYLFGRVAADGSAAGAMAQSVKDRLQQIEQALRPTGNNADEWHAFLAEHTDALPYVAVQIAEAIDRAALRAPPPPTAAYRGVPGQRVSDVDLNGGYSFASVYDLASNVSGQEIKDLIDDLRDCRAALATAPKAEDVRRGALNEAIDLAVRAGRGGFAQQLRALADRPAR